MAILFGVVVFLFVIVCILLCLLVLIQSDKGGGISGALGGGLSGANSLFGSQDTANILTRATTVMAFIFMGLCIAISLFLSHRTASTGKSILKERAEKQNFSPASVLQGQGLPLGEGEQQDEASAPGQAPEAIPLESDKENE